jgi:choline dehydrogenase-like flavoprotein
VLEPSPCAVPLRIAEALLHLALARFDLTRPDSIMPVTNSLADCLVVATTLCGSELDWAYSTTAQAGLDGRELFWPRGKVLGGCSSINAQIWTRGHRGWSGQQAGPDDVSVRVDPGGDGGDAGAYVGGQSIRR